LRHPYEQRPITAAKAKARWRSPQSNGELMTEKQQGYHWRGCCRTGWVGWSIPMNIPSSDQ
jgi:hypothetical protein